MNLAEHPKLKILFAAYGQLARREQRLISVTLLFVVVVAGVSLLDAFWQDNRQMSNLLLDTRSQIADLTASAEQLRKEPVNDPNPPLRLRRQQLLLELEQLQQRHRNDDDSMISPRQLAVMLESVLAETADLQLLALENLEPELLLLGATDADGKRDEILWRHGLRLKIRCSWSATLEYLHRLRQLPGRVYWESLDYELTSHPWGELRLELFTISASKEVVGA